MSVYTGELELSRKSHIVTHVCLVLTSSLMALPVLASDWSVEESVFVYPNGYAMRRHRASAYSGKQTDVRNRHVQSDVEYLWQEAHRLHPSDSVKTQIEKTYLEFESSLQKAADELRTTEPSKSDWAAELIAYYTRPKHRWPAVSKSLDQALAARQLLVRLTSEEAVKHLERQLYRFEATEDKSHYYNSPDLRPQFRRRF